MTFTLTEEHIKLLQELYFEWYEDFENPGIAINFKRPFGNGDMITDILEILGKEAKECPYCGERLDEELEERCETLYKETLTALKVILSTKKFEPGKYVTRDGSNWEKVSEESEIKIYMKEMERQVSSLNSNNNLKKGKK